MHFLKQWKAYTCWKPRLGRNNQSRRHRYRHLGGRCGQFRQSKRWQRQKDT